MNITTWAGWQETRTPQYGPEPLHPIRFKDKPVHNDASQRFQHLAFMKHAKALLQPYRELGPCRPYRYAGLSISLYYSHQVGVVLSIQKTRFQVNARTDAKRRPLPPNLQDRLALWKTALNAENLDVREQVLACALLNFTPPEAPSTPQTSHPRRRIK